MTPQVEGIADELLKLAQLRESGILTEEEFAAQKAVLLASTGASAGAPPQPIPNTVEVTCQSCGETSTVEADAKQFDCAHCGKSLRFVRCVNCKHLNHVPEEVAYWKCADCNLSQTSAWNYPLQIECRCGMTNAVPFGRVFKCDGCHQPCRLCYGCGNYMRMGPVASSRWLCPNCQTTN